MRKKRHQRTLPGEGVVMVQSIVASLLDDWIGVDPFLQLVRAGALDGATRNADFALGGTGNRTIEGRPVVPTGAPAIRGVLTWRRAPGKWSLDMNECMLGPNVRFWSNVSPGIASIRFDGVTLPETLMTVIPGRRLIDVVEHRHITDKGIVIVSGSCTAPTSRIDALSGQMRTTPAMTQLRITVPTADHDDPPCLPWASIEPVAVRNDMSIQAE